jgi:hypothetical protein
MSADVVHLAIMAISYCQAAGRLMVHRGFAAGIGVLTQDRTRWKSE